MMAQFLTSISPEEEEIWGVTERAFSYTPTGFQPPRMVKPVSPDLMSCPDEPGHHKGLAGLGTRRRTVELADNWR